MNIYTPVSLDNLILPLESDVTFQDMSNQIEHEPFQAPHQKETNRATLINN